MAVLLKEHMSRLEDFVAKLNLILWAFDLFPDHFI